MEKINKYFGVFLAIVIMTIAFVIPTQIVYADNDFPINVTSGNLDYKNSTLYFTDTTNKQICEYNQNTKETTSFSTANTPELVVADFDGNAFYTQLGSAGMFDKNGNRIREFGSEHFDIGKIYDLDCDINNNIYALGRDNDNNFYIFVKTQNSDVFEVFCALNEVSVDSFSKITVSLDKNYVVLLTQNQFYKVEKDCCVSLNGYSGLTTILENIKDIKLDYHNSLFILTNQKLYKSTQDEITYFENDILTSMKTFELEYLSGEIFCETNSEITKIDSENFVDSLAGSTIVDYQNTKYDCDLIKTTKNSILYCYDNCIYTKTLNNETIVIPENTTICKISKTNTDFYFVLINNLSNENITGFIKCSDAQIVPAPEDTKTIKILYNNAPLYTYPSKLTQEFLAKDDNNNPICLNKNTLHTMIVENFSMDYDGTKFSKIEYSGTTYYIETNYYIENTTSTISPIDINQNETSTANETALTTGEIVGIVLICLTAIGGAVLILVTILKKEKNKKEL